jgi:hypothetical protein
MPAMNWSRIRTYWTHTSPGIFGGYYSRLGLLAAWLCLIFGLLGTFTDGPTALAVVAAIFMLLFFVDFIISSVTHHKK